MKPMYLYIVTTSEELCVCVLNLSLILKKTYLRLKKQKEITYCIPDFYKVVKTFITGAINDL